MATARHMRMACWLAPLLAVLWPACGLARAQNPSEAPAQDQSPGQNLTRPAEPLPPSDKTLTLREEKDQAKLMEEAAEAVRINKLARINGVPYDQPSTGDTFRAYARDTYGWPAAVSTTVRAGYSQLRGKPANWDFPERFGSAYGIQLINGNVRYGMEVLFHEDLRYLPCHRCGAKAKLENALLAEITARHSDDGHRFFTLTPTVADFSGPIIAHTLWYPTYDPLQGVISARLVFATRIGGHLFQEFVMDKIHPGLKPQN